ncbi:MAG: thioredoxin family protein [Acidobacteriota bacterium]
MKPLTLALFTVLLSGQLSAGGWLKSYAQATSEAKKNDQLIFVDLFAEWCGWCHRMEREVFPSEKFQNATEGMVLLRVDTEDGAEGTRLARQYEVSQLPTFLILSPDGLLAGLIYGYAPAEDFAPRVTKARKDYDSFRKELKQESSFQNDFGRRDALAAAFIARRGFTQAESRLNRLLAEPAIPADVRNNAYYHLAFTQMSQNRFPEAISTLRKFFGVETQGEPLERARLLLGQIYYEQGDFRSAVSELRSFKKSFPRSKLIAEVDAILPGLEKDVQNTH